MELALQPTGLLEFLHSRRSVRRFLPESIDSELLERILETATWAPSAHNRQPWRFVVLTTVEAKALLAEQMGADFHRDLLADGLSDEEAGKLVAHSRDRILQAPVVILLCLDPTVGDSYPDPERQQAEYIMGVQGVALSAGTLLLAAHAEGLGGVWVCSPLFAKETVRNALDLPYCWDPQGMVLLGYPAVIPERRPRRPLEEVTRYL
ncbi:MAG TPA: nitroreductase family protein [Anaerolineales bacterium]|jgi:F420 biosynthesis protein FbiB-like protein|nr:nitroreductase family protein [Anaerolineales bacterium]